MKTLKLLVVMIGLITLSISIFSLKKIRTSNENLIIGTWVAEDDANIKMVFTAGGLEKDYIDGKLEDTYHWTIEKDQTPSGLTIPNLILTNVADSGDVYDYIIDTLTEERLILVYDNGGHITRSTYIRQ